MEAENCIRTMKALFRRRLRKVLVTQISECCCSLRIRKTCFQIGCQMGYKVKDRISLAVSGTVTGWTGAKVQTSRRPHPPTWPLRLSHYKKYELVVEGSLSNLRQSGRSELPLPSV